MAPVELLEALRLALGVDEVFAQGLSKNSYAVTINGESEDVPSPHDVARIVRAELGMVHLWCHVGHAYNDEWIEQERGWGTKQSI